MHPGAVTIRKATEVDLLELIEILNYYISNTYAQFTAELHTLDSGKAWFEGYGSGRYHLLVAEGESGILGCTYSSRYRAAPAFDTTVEMSIYLHPERRGVGVGSLLYAALLAILETEDVHLAVAGVAQPNAASNALQRKFGFQEVGTFKEYARKGETWISSTWFQKVIN